MCCVFCVVVCVDVSVLLFFRMSYCGVCVITHVCTHSIICTDAYVYIYLHADACI